MAGLLARRCPRRSGRRPLALRQRRRGAAGQPRPERPRPGQQRPERPRPGRRARDDAPHKPEGLPGADGSDKKSPQLLFEVDVSSFSCHGT